MPDLKLLASYTNVRNKFLQIARNLLAWKNTLL